MRRPARETVRSNGHTFFVSSQTVDRKPFFRHERWAILMQEVFQHYRGNSYLLHAYVIMPDHFHLIISPETSLERAMQNIKGGFSFRAKSAFDWKHNIWQPGFSDHRIRDAADWDCHIAYMKQNPVKSKLCSSSEDYRYLAVDLDPIPQRLKPFTLGGFDGGAEAPPLQTAHPGTLENPTRTADTRSANRTEE
ncbi:MAG: REP-associated tyrosine transposase [Acidobacteriaceae bacterium]|jgi:putative transposase|nr:REP-associated tyrosine transposase [Acidobacteriaceae bacterium]